VLTLIGAMDRLGGFFVLASIREFAPFITAIVMAGVAGTAQMRQRGIALSGC
jgi:phospholipid/cholesterol/gamma-HCH transport system permease protein